MSTPSISYVKSKDRFQQIYQFLHLADNSQQPPVGTLGHHKLFKVHAILDRVEDMIPFNGWLSLKQCMKISQPTVGSNFSHSATHRKVMHIACKYILNSTLDFGLFSCVVLELMNCVEGNGHHLFTDNYYTSPQLYLTLYNKGTYCCGMVRPNRKGFLEEIVKHV